MKTEALSDSGVIIVLGTSNSIFDCIAHVCLDCRKSKCKAYTSLISLSVA